MSEVDIKVLTAPFTPGQIKQRQIGGGKMADYVPGEVVINRLNEATGNNWDLTIKSIDERPMAGGTLVMAMVALTIPGLGTREHIGVQMVQDRAGEDLIKGAVTDACKKAASLFGVGLHLYDDEAPGPPQRQQSAPANRAPARQQAPNQNAPAAAGAQRASPGDSWQAFWPWAKSNGHKDKAAIEQAIGRSMDGLMPDQIVELLGAPGKAGARQ